MKQNKIPLLSLLFPFFLFLACFHEKPQTFPDFPAVSVTDSMHFFYSYGDAYQFLAVDLSSDTIVQRYQLKSGDKIINNFIYIPQQKKCYFTFWGETPRIMEFDPATGKAKRIGNVDLINADTVFPLALDNESLTFMDNYGEKLYRYYYDTKEFTVLPYRFLGTPFQFEDETYIVTADSPDSIWTERRLFNWTKQQETGIDLNDHFPNMPYLPDEECSSFLHFYKKGFIGKRITKSNKSTTTLYRLESISPEFKISGPITQLDHGCYFSFEYGEFLYLLCGDYYEDLLKYNPDNPKDNGLVDSYRTHYPGTSGYNPTLEVKQYRQNGKYLYSINLDDSKEAFVIKIDLEDFSVKVIK